MLIDKITLNHMQKLFIAIALLVASCSTFSQETYTDRFYKKFKAYDEGGEDLIKPALTINAGFSGSDSKGWFNKVVKFRVLVLNDQKAPSLREEWDGLIKALGKDEYDDLVTVRQGKGYLRLMSKDINGDLKDVVLLISDKDGGSIFVNLRGRFTAHDIDQIQSAFQDETASSK
jgi:Domain of unknown function (DUF4252)